MKSKKVDTYMVIFIGDKTMSDDLSGCMVLTCSNKNTLAKITGISFNRIVYIFTKLKKMTLNERGMFIIKSERYYKGSQPGGLINPALKRNVY